MLQPLDFGRFQILPDQRELRVDGRAVPLGGRAFDVLLALVTRRDRLVAKSELMELAWPGVVVEENNLQVQISALRKWLEEKRMAQEKASEALYNAAIYLGTPGNTLAGWLKEQRASGQSSPPQDGASGASQPQGQTVIDGYSIEEVP